MRNFQFIMLAVGKVLKRLAEKGVLVLVASHDGEFLETVCDRLFRPEVDVATGQLSLSMIEN